jgi:hypothetical protein
MFPLRCDDSPHHRRRAQQLFLPALPACPETSWARPETSRTGARKEEASSEEAAAYFADR